MIELKSDEWIRIKGRGFLALIKELPPAFYAEYHDPQQLNGKEVKINGEVFTVVATETYMIGRSEDHPYMLSCGLLVRESLSPFPYYNPSTLRPNWSIGSYPLGITESRGPSPMPPGLVGDNSNIYPSEPPDTDTVSTS